MQTRRACTPVKILAALAAVMWLDVAPLQAQAPPAPQQNADIQAAQPEPAPEAAADKLSDEELEHW